MSRLEVLKTYKIFIGGQFPRTESGRYYAPQNAKGEKLGNICLSSRKDLRNAITAARSSFGSWSEKSAFNRSQILYRIAEIMEGRRSQFEEELIFQGCSKNDAQTEVEISIDRLIYYAGWCDKYNQVLSSVNPVASSHFNFTTSEPMGVIGIFADENHSLLGLVSQIVPIIASGNTCVVVASECRPLCAITFAEVLNTSDVPGGVANILTGKKSELMPTMVEHMDVNAINYHGENSNEIKQLEEGSIHNLKRIRIYQCDWKNEQGQNISFISDCLEMKTTWHPIENIGGASSSY